MLRSLDSAEGSYLLCHRPRGRDCIHRPLGTHDEVPGADVEATRHQSIHEERETEMKLLAEILIDFGILLSTFTTVWLLLHFLSRWETKE